MGARQISFGHTLLLRQRLQRAQNVRHLARIDGIGDIRYISLSQFARSRTNHQKYAHGCMLHPMVAKAFQYVSMRKTLPPLGQHISHNLPTYISHHKHSPWITAWLIPIQRTKNGYTKTRLDSWHTA